MSSVPVGAAWLPPLLESTKWLRRKCTRAAVSCPDLTAEDLFQEVRTRYLKKAPAWFQKGSTRSPVARARYLLRTLIGHVVTHHYRRDKFHADLDETSESDGPAIEAMAIQQDHGAVVEAALQLEVVTAHMLSLPNSTYRLALLAIYQWSSTAFQHFEDARTVFNRDLQAAWELFLGHQQDADWPDDEPHRRWTFSETVRSKEPMGTLSQSDKKRHYDWLDKNIQRARKKLRESLQAGLSLQEAP